MLRPRIQGLTVLVVDNDERVLASVGAVLEVDGFAAHLAESAERALEIVTREVVHFSILDVFVSEATGPDILKRLRRVRAPLPAILMSGNFTPGIREEAARLGVFSMIEKPLDALRLRGDVRRLAESLAGTPGTS